MTDMSTAAPPAQVRVVAFHTDAPVFQRLVDAGIVGSTCAVVDWGKMPEYYVVVLFNGERVVLFDDEYSIIS